MAVRRAVYSSINGWSSRSLNQFLGITTAIGVSILTAGGFRIHTFSGSGTFAF